MFRGQRVTSEEEEEEVRSSELCLVLAAGAPVFQQLVEDAALLQRSQVGDVLGDHRHVLAAAARPGALVLVAVGQRAQEGVVLVGGEVIPGERETTIRV